MDVEQTAAREDAFELVLLQLIHTSAAGDDDGFDVQVVQGVGDTVEQHAVIGGDALTLIFLAARGLRIAAAQVARWQHRRRAHFVQHGLCGQPHLREQTF